MWLCDVIQNRDVPLRMPGILPKSTFLRLPGCQTNITHELKIIFAIFLRQCTLLNELYLNPLHNHHWVFHLWWLLTKCMFSFFSVWKQLPNGFYEKLKCSLRYLMKWSEKSAPKSLYLFNLLIYLQFSSIHVSISLLFN